MLIGKQQKQQYFRGGKRNNAGRKKIFGEPTKTLCFRCPLSKIEELKKYVNDKILEWK
jgi:hypothetical protein